MQTAEKDATSAGICSEHDLYCYLAFGWIPSLTPAGSRIIESFEKGARQRFLRATEDELIDRFCAELRGAVRRCLDSTTDYVDHRLLLSGGLDSRALLMVLLEQAPLERLSAVTSGLPEDPDVYIATELARRTGIVHRVIDPRDYEWNESDLIRKQRGKAAVGNPFGEWFPLWKDSQADDASDVPYWNGFMGDASTGAHLPDDEPTTWSGAVEQFAGWNRVVHSTDLLPTDVRAAQLLPPEPLADASTMSYPDQLDLVLRQQCWIGVGLERSPVRYVTPFADSKWLTFVARLNRTHRLRQRLFRQALLRLNPDLATLDTPKGSVSPPAAERSPRRVAKVAARAAARTIGLFDWISRLRSDGGSSKTRWDTEMLHVRRDWRSVVRASLRDLSARGVVPWIDIERLWDEHERRVAGHRRAILHLAAVELTLKARESESQA